MRRFLLAPALLIILGAAALAGAYSSGLLSTSALITQGEPYGSLSLDVSGMTDTGTSDNAYNAVGPIGTTASVTDTCDDESDMIIVELVIGDSGTQDGVDETGGIPRGTAETGTECENAVDDDGDGLVNDGCPANAMPESKTQCLDDLDNEALPDSLVNDGCPQSDGVDIGGWQARIQFDPDVLTFLGHQISHYAAGAQYYMEKASVNTAVTNDHLSLVDPSPAPGIGTFDIGSTVLGTPPGANGVGLLARLYFDCAPGAAGGGGTCIEIGDSSNSFYTDMEEPGENHNYVAGNPVALGVNGGAPPTNCQAMPTPPTETPTPAPTPTPPPTPFEPHASFSLADTTPGANSDYTVEFDIGVGPDGQIYTPDDTPDYMFDAAIAFTPEEFSAGREAEVPIGALMARLTSVATLGLVNVACSSPVTPVFDMMNATTDITNVLPDAYGVLEGRNPGSADDQFDIGADGLPLGVTKYPDYLNRILVDSDGNPLQPRARLYGQIMVAGTDVSLNLAQFDPGTNIGDTQLDPALGFPAVTVLQNTADPEALLSPNPITDFCTPLTTSTTVFAVSKDNPDTAADEGGVEISANPAGDQTYNFVLFAASMPDADNDGIENFLDSCPLDGNPDGWDPRDIATAGDADGDGLPDSCDPTPNSNLPVNDTDADFYANRGDNCSLEANGVSPGPDGLPGTEDDVVIGPNNQADRDTDQIGDACDPNPDTRDGDIVTVCRCTAVNVGAGGSAPPCPNLCSEDKVGIDLDGDGIFDSLQPTPTPTPTPTPPPNDNFADARLVSEAELPFSDSQQIAAATVELGEPSGCLFLDSTVWYKFTPSTRDEVRANTGGSDVPVPFINVYSAPDPASLQDLSLETCGSSVSFTPTRNLTYYFQVGDGYGARSGTLAFNLDQGIHDARARRISSPYRVLGRGDPDLGEIEVTLRNESTHAEMIGLYLDLIPPGGVSNPGGCIPSGRILETAAFLDSGRQTRLFADTGTLGDGQVEFSCTNQAAVVGLTYTIVAAVDVHADDLEACGPGTLYSLACFNALADDDNDPTDNRAVRNAPMVQQPK